MAIESLLLKTAFGQRIAVIMVKEPAVSGVI